MPRSQFSDTRGRHLQNKNGGYEMASLRNEQLHSRADFLNLFLTEGTPIAAFTKKPRRSQSLPAYIIDYNILVSMTVNLI